jgi:hypothetical protein
MRVFIVMRNLLLSLLFTLSALGVSAIAQESGAGTFQQVKAKTLDKEKFAFPDDMRGSQLNVMFLDMGTDRASEETQELALIDWHVALEKRGIFDEQVMPYHFPVIAGVPSFLKGTIAGSMKDSYEGKVPFSQVSVLFVKDLASFADSAGLTVDGQPTIVITTSDAKPIRTFKGRVSPGGVDDIVAAIGQLK